jgi:hypothetical protein
MNPEREPEEASAQRRRRIRRLDVADSTDLSSSHRLKTISVIDKRRSG